MQKIASDTERFLNALRPRHDKINAYIGDSGLYGAMSNYTGQSHLKDALKSDMIGNAMLGLATGAISAPFMLPALGIATAPANYLRSGAAIGLGSAAAATALGNIAKYYLGKSTSKFGE